ncbi:hypothetical protein E1J82_19760 [Salmonella enterica subsp. enterica serovar Yovokome]|nr:hypothetical protein [Salmonella enterica subsp. enterica serovar Yovokome]
MKLYRATYSLLELDGHVKVDEQWVFFEAEDRSDALEKIPDLLKAMWECSGSQLEVWNLYNESDLVILRFLVSPSWLARLNKALVECRSAGGQHE